MKMATKNRFHWYFNLKKETINSLLILQFLGTIKLHHLINEFLKVCVTR